ncbi:hypothetical protein QBC45DRAFT_426213 [Copromyces sp. CBS 386.78]|nr:hypothetical protein QBC45DRAFT_426213 [Copromyces sp. CBS 386.78]
MARIRRWLVCNLCQTIIPPGHEDLNRADVEGRISRLDWHKETRAVRAVRDTFSPFLTGVGFLDTNCVLEASHDPDVAYISATRHQNPGLRNDAILGQSGTGQTNNPKYLAFVFHDACWQLFLAGILPGLPDSVTTCRAPQEQVGLVAEALFLGELCDDRLDPNTNTNGGRVGWYMRNKRCIQVG